MKVFSALLFAVMMASGPLAHARDQDAQRPADDLDAIQNVMEQAVAADDTATNAQDATQNDGKIMTATVDSVDH